MIRQPPRSTPLYSSAASDVYKRQVLCNGKISRLSINSFKFKNGVWGVAPRQVAGTPVPVFSPFPGKGGRGIGIINLLFFIKTDFFYKMKT